MVYFSEKEIENLITEDSLYYDLTSKLLRIENKPAKIFFNTKEETLICATEEVLKMFAKVNIIPTLISYSGEYLEKEVKFLEGEGLIRNINLIVRSATNLLSYASGIATRTRILRDRAKKINPDVSIATTGKHLPYTRKICAKAVLAGGGSLDRLGLAESIFIDNAHLNFLENLDSLDKKIQEQRHLASYKPIIIEAINPDQALTFANLKIDIIQLSNFTPMEVKQTITGLVNLKHIPKIAVAAEITPENIDEYVRTGAGILVTTWPYLGPAADISVSIEPMMEY